MDISPVTAPVLAPIKTPEASVDKSPEVNKDGDGTRMPQPTVLAALPPGQGTRVNQLA